MALRPGIVRPGSFGLPASDHPVARLGAVDVGFAGFCTLIAVVRFLILVEPGAPPGIDGGNWLTLGHALLGRPVRPPSFVYPPVVPLVVVGAVALLGPVAGVAVVAALASILPAVGAYVVLRGEALGVWAAGLAALLAPLAATGEATAWGGYPQLMATAFGAVALWMLDGLLRNPENRRRALMTGAVLALTLAMSHFIGAVVVLAAVVIAGLHRALFRRDPETPPIRQTLVSLTFVVLPCLPLIPLYTALARAIGGGYQARPSSLRVSLSSLLPHVELLYRDFPMPWRGACAVALVTPLLAGPARRRPLWIIPTGLIVSAGLFLAVTGEPRALHLLPVVAVLTAGFWLDALRRLDRLRGNKQRMAVASGLGLLVVVTSITGLRFFDRKRNYYNVLTPGVVTGIEWVRENTPSGVLVAVTAVEDAPLGWWVEGLGRRPALSGSALKWLYVDDERDRARTANEIFARAEASEPGLAGPSAVELAHQAGAGYLFVARSSTAYDLAWVERLREGDPATVMFENDEVVIVRVPAPPVPGGSITTGSADATRSHEPQGD